MSENKNGIDPYLARLRHRIPVVDAWWERALSEVEDHLHTAVERAPEGLDPADAEAEAIRRFGSEAGVLSGLAAEYACHLVKRYGAWLAGLGAAFMLVALVSANGPLLIGHIGQDLLLSSWVFVLVQIGWFTALLTGVRVVFVLGRRQGLSGLGALLRGAGVMLASFSAAAALKLAALVWVQGFSPVDLGLAAMLLLVALASPLLLRSISRIRSAVAVLEFEGGGEAPQKALPVLRTARLFRLLAERPWAMVVGTCVLAALWAFNLGAMPDGLWPSLVGSWGRAGAGALSAGIDVAAVLACYWLVGPWIGVREQTGKALGQGPVG